MMPMPTSLQHGGQELPCWSYSQLHNLNRKNLDMRARDLRDRLGADNCPRLARDHEGTVAWIIDVQVALANRHHCMQLTPADFGAPARHEKRAQLTASEVTLLQADTCIAPKFDLTVNAGMPAGAHASGPATSPFASPSPDHAAFPQEARNEFQYKPCYAEATAASYAAAETARNKDRGGSLGGLIFTEPPEPVSPTKERDQPPYQTAPPGRLGISASTTAESYRPPPASYRPRDSCKPAPVPFRAAHG